ncbi:DNA-binding response regulator [Rhodoferax lacus]|uniref:DNA-binding response regulator n=1 Tax=Rhodoferax lacus TaxID=2184758 RepID=A0A3E1RB69_9BURK|nr:response regulator transcription factor [Rhodoferax lacus]RFO96614.1 DNA-binding response regulator [Rhodoferax lacus]
MKSRLIIADDHHVVRQGLRDMVRGTQDLEVVAEASDGIQVEEVVRSTMAELLVLDIGLPLRRGIAVLERLRASGILLPVLMFSMYPASQYAGIARRAGAQGFLGKEAHATEVMRALYQVLAGGTWFPPHAKVRPKPDAVDDPFGALSPRELQVFKALLAGTSLQEQSVKLQLSTKTISTYRTRLLSKLGLRSNAELVALAICHGYH